MVSNFLLLKTKIEHLDYFSLTNCHTCYIVEYEVIKDGQATVCTSETKKSLFVQLAFGALHYLLYIGPGAEMQAIKQSYKIYTSTSVYLTVLGYN